MRDSLIDAREFRLSEWSVTPADGLLQAAHGVHRLPPRVMRLLVLLVSRAQQVVSKKEIIDRVWDNGAVSDDSLSASLYQLRKALGDDPARPRFIETIPKRGYRLLVPPEFDGKGPAAPDSNPAALRSLAVLPLHSPSRDPDDAALAEGLTAVFITELARLRPLRVISMTSAMVYAGTPKRAPEIAQELQVEVLLEGSVIRAGDRLRIDCRLVDAVRDSHLWADTFERKTTDLLAVQSEIARAVASEVGARLNVERNGLGRAQLPAEAIEDYLKGRALLATQRQSGLMQAKLYFERALVIEERSAETQAALAITYVELLYARQHEFAHWAEGARRAARFALELDATLGDAHAAHALVLGYVDGKFAAADSAFRRAFELQPDRSLMRRRHALVLAVMQRPDEALRQLDEADRYDPVSPYAAAVRADVLLMLRRFDRAAHELVKAVESEPRHWLAHMSLAFIHWTRGDFGELLATHRAAALACDRAELVPELEAAFAGGGVAGLYSHLARHIEACEAQHPSRLAELIVVHTVAGDRERALSLLEQASDQSSPSLLWLLPSPFVDPLRSDARFVALLARHAARGTPCDEVLASTPHSNPV